MMGLLYEAVDRATSLSGSANIAVIGGCQMFAAKMEEVGNRAVDGNEPHAL